MFHIGIEQQESVEMIVRVTGHLPIGAALGRIRAVGREGIMVCQTDGAFATYGYDADDDHAWRVIDVGHDLHERTGWRNGEEIVRHVFRAPSTAR